MAALTSHGSTLLAALAYASRGWRVVALHAVLPGGACTCGRPACRPGGADEKSIGKHPRLPSWQTLATVDETAIRSWWAAHPLSNVGIATGAASGLLALDVDVHRGAPGPASLADLERSLGPLPRTRASRTGSGGLHLLFRYPSIPGATVGCRARWLGRDGIDWRGDGGQIVAPPSVAAAGSYAWEDEADPVDLPARWVEALVTQKERPRPTRAPSSARPMRSEVDDPEDAEVVAAARDAACGEKFSALMDGRWPDAGYESHSEADLALCSLLAFFSDRDDPEPDPDRVDRIFRKSGLYRAKWERVDYRARTVALAVEGEVIRREEDRWLSDALAAVVLPAHPLPARPGAVPPETQPSPQETSNEGRTRSARDRRRESVRRKLASMAEGKSSSTDARQRHAGTAVLSSLSAGFTEAYRDVRTREIAVKSAFNAIAFDLSDVTFDEAAECLGVHSEEDFRGAAEAHAAGRRKREKWDAAAPARAEKRAAEVYKNHLTVEAEIAAIRSSR